MSADDESSRTDTKQETFATPETVNDRTVQLKDFSPLDRDGDRKCSFEFDIDSKHTLQDPGSHPLFAMDDMAAYSHARPRQQANGADDAMTDVDALLWNYGLAHTAQKDAENEYLRREEHRLHQQNGLKATCYRVASSVPFKVLFASLVVLNFVAVTIDAQIGVNKISDPGDQTANRILLSLQIAEHIFVALFVTEITVRILGSPVQIWEDGWLMVDTIIVLVSVVDTWLLGIFLATPSALRATSALRMLRGLRALRIIRMFRFANKVQVLAEALGEALLSICSILALLIFITWIAAILFTSSIGCLHLDTLGYSFLMGAKSPPELFKSVGSSMLTLNLVLLESFGWATTIVMPLLFSSDTETVMCGFSFGLFVTLGSLCWLNLITGIFIRSILQAANRRKAVIDRETLFSSNNSLNKLKEVYRMLDENGDGMLSFVEFKNGLVQHPEMFQELGITLEQAQRIYQELQDGDDNLVKIDEFLLGVIKMTRSSQSVDMISIDFNQQKTLRDIMTVKRVYDQDERLMCHYMIKIDDFLRNIGEEIQSLSDELAPDMEKQRDADSMLTKKEDDPDSGPNTDLEARFNFMTRLAALKADVKDLSSKAKKEGLAGLLASQKSSSSKHPVSSSLIQRASLSNAKLGDAWQTIMREDVLPWLRRELAQSAQKRAIQESLAFQESLVAQESPAVQIPHSHNMPSHGEPDTQRKLHDEGSGPSLLSSTLKAIDKRSPLYIGPARASQQSIVQQGQKTTNFGNTLHTNPTGRR